MTSAAPPLVLDVGLARTPAAGAAAREHVRAAFGEVLAPERFADVQLAVTELVANAVNHGTGAIRLRVRVEDGRLYGEVIDDGGGFEHAIREAQPRRRHRPRAGHRRRAGRRVGHPRRLDPRVVRTEHRRGIRSDHGSAPARRRATPARARIALPPEVDPAAASTPWLR